MIDSQHSFFKYQQTQSVELAGDLTDDPMFQQDYLLAELEDDLDFSGVDQVISVQTERSNRENQLLLEQAKQSDGLVAGVVGWAPLVSSSRRDLRLFLEQYMFEPLMKGYREVVDSAFLESLEIDSGLRELTRRDLSFELMATAELLPEVISFVDKHPNQRIAINHSGSPVMGSAEPSKTWARNMRELARRPHVFCKLSGLSTPHRHGSQFLQPYFDQLVDAFTPDRLMLASNWPWCKKTTTYQEWLNLNDDFIHRLNPDEQQAIRRETAVRFYNITTL